MPELTRRYVVMAMATEGPFDLADPDGVFVLKPWKDPAALRALIAYRDNCYPELAADLDEWVRRIEAGPVIRGDVGRRNEPHLRSHGGQARRASSPRRQPASRARARRRAPAAHTRSRKRPASHRKKRRR